TYVRNYGDNQIYRIAGGPNIDDYKWTDVLMREAADHMDGLSLHYYTMPGEFWTGKGAATNFPESDWDLTMHRAYHIKELIEKHSAIMDKYDPEKRVGLIIDEWGTWYDVEEGTNPGFLYQQNTIRDALVAGVSLNIFNDHSDRVQMANIAQTINVLQSMILTDKEKMILTPTYHVFEMYKVHQDAEKLALHVDTNVVKMGEKEMSQVTASASKAADGKVNITLVNVSKDEDAEFTLDVRGLDISTIKGRVLTAGELDAHNTFDNPENVKPEEFTSFQNSDGELAVKMPSKSVVLLTIE